MSDKASQGPDEALIARLRVALDSPVQGNGDAEWTCGAAPDAQPCAGEDGSAVSEGAERSLAHPVVSSAALEIADSMLGIGASGAQRSRGPETGSGR